ncbi:hypothetical protein ACW2AV_000156 [Cronobacter sakazakii]|uniref:hypothetical protein n=1 Tax=Enterobacteriaceae TaxID=543 RepID=UPI000735C09E|nr:MULTISPECIES: hypothetical protein [Enterobacteriaceae]EIX1499948.1 hypothetical protein [Cronobacter sakazakii]EIX6180243.1 hypothetical protein [Cronobacter sakazakii]EIX6196534.1 hypothetical protein [Cronobacter sakazakii]EIX6203948.1 hypothetical protein [Cronobacter sakazakii]EIX6247151.1 hypothetical protein [Cronobacter sakazakii]
MSSITAKILSKLNNSDFNVGVLSADNADRAALVKVKPEDIDTLIDNLQQLKTYVADLQESKQANARRLLESLVKESTDFSSVDELLSVLGGTQAAAAASSSTGNNTKQSSNKAYEVVLLDKATDTHKRFNVVNKILPKALLNDETYQEIIAKNKDMNDIDLFLRAYSSDYAEQYPINAKWKKHTFHLNQKGRLNAQSAKYYEEYKAEHPDSDEKAFKQFVSDSYKKV